MPAKTVTKYSTEHIIEKKSALSFSTMKGAEIYELLYIANKLRIEHKGSKVDLCSIINAKSGACPEDCSFCAQSAHSRTAAKVYPLLEKKEILKAALSAKENRARRFCIVTSGKKTSASELDKICDLISDISLMGLLPCATLGMLDEYQLSRLRDAGLHRYHHNLETSEAFFKEICTTHTYKDKLRTINCAKSLGLSVCSGGIFGLGESWEDRIDMAFAIRDTGADSVPINFLSPIAGTPMGNSQTLSPMEALKIVAIYRIIMPDREIRICGGRRSTLRGLTSHLFLAGADGLLIGNYLTTSGGDPAEDIQMIKDMGLEL
ncbi:MAG: biotin synthase BioB [Nitrospirae bacterium]|nr:biotin synthase BioB [Nitrospirota bacterium]